MVHSGIKHIIKYWLLDLPVLFFPKKIVPKSILVIRLDSIGDYVLFRNFMGLLSIKKEYAGYEISLCGNVEWKNLAEVLDGNIIKNFFWIDRTRFVSDFYYRFKELLKINKHGYELIISPVFSREILYADSIVRTGKANKKIGCRGDNNNSTECERKIYNRYFTNLFTIESANTFEFLKNKELFEKIFSEKIEIKKPFIEFYKIGKKKNEKKYAIICPGAKDIWRRWNLKQFIEIADYLFYEYDLQSVFVGSKNEQPENLIKTELLKRNYITNKIGDTTLIDSIELIMNAQIFIGNDSGLAHISVAVNIPCVVISNGNYYGRFTEYPSSVYEKINYVYPPEIDKSTEKIEAIVEKYKNGSNLNINLINTKDVINSIHQVYSLK